MAWRRTSYNPLPAKSQIESHDHDPILRHQATMNYNTMDMNGMLAASNDVITVKHAVRKKQLW